MALPRRVGKYSLTSKLGSGQYGDVFKGENEQNVPIAAKCVSKSRINPFLESRLNAEIAVLKKVVSPYVVKLIEAISTNNNYYLVMEFCEGSDLSKMMKRFGRIPLHIARRWLTNIVDAFLALRANHVMHRDLKPANVLLTSLDPELACVKLADFGFAKFSSEGQLSRTVIGSPLYMAPEIHENSSYDSKIDVWSFGVLASELLGAGLFSNITTSQELSDLQKHLMFSQLDLPPDAIEVLEHSLVYEAQRRFSFEELRALPFFQADLIPLDLGNSNPFTLSSVQIVQSDSDGRTQNYLDMSCMLYTKIRKIWDLGWEMDRCGKKLLAVALFQIELKEIKQYQVDIQNKLNEHADSGLEKLQREAAAKAVEATAAVSTTAPFLSAGELSSLSLGVDLQLFIDEAIQRVQEADNGQRPLREKQKSYQDALTLLLIVRNEGGEGVQPLIDQYCDSIYEMGLLVR